MYSATFRGPRSRIRETIREVSGDNEVFTLQSLVFRSVSS